MAAVLIEMEEGAGPDQIEEVMARLADAGFEPRVGPEGKPRKIGGVGGETPAPVGEWQSLPGVLRVIPLVTPFTLVGREFQAESTVIEVGKAVIGDGRLIVVAGPCAVESRDQLWDTAVAVKAAGASILRGDAFKPRTSPYSFQGLGEEGLKMLADIRAELGLPFVAEVLDPRHVELVAGYADMLRVGTRNMSNYPLLAEVGRQPKPVQLKRGFNATVDEWLTAAEYIYKEGNPRIVLVERGIRTFDTATRNTLDITAVALAKLVSHLPVMVDPSHAVGRADLVAPLARAAVAVGADGIMIDVHPSPDTARVDGAQALTPSEFADLMDSLRLLAASLGPPQRGSVNSP